MAIKATFGGSIPTRRNEITNGSGTSSKTKCDVVFLNLTLNVSKIGREERDGVSKYLVPCVSHTGHTMI